jgi:hypothetical protein
VVRGIVLGTGPSVTPDQIELIKKSGLPVYGCNNAYQIVDLTALLACNIEWWAHYWRIDEALRNGDFEKWTWDRATADRYGIGYIKGEWGKGLSTDPAVIHYGHSSGYQLVNLAYHYGVREMILVGYDLRYPPGYDGMKKIAGGDRHYFGEYPKELQHWTKFGIGDQGELCGLLDCYRTIKPEDYGLRIVNCSPGSALDFFETGDLSEWV